MTNTRYRLRGTFALLSLALSLGTVSAQLVHDTPPASTELISLSRDWKLLTASAEPPADWTAFAFDDSSWQEAPAVIGNLESPDLLKRYGLELGTPLPPDRTTRYLRTSFELAERPARGSELLLDYFIKDGGVLHLNGKEIGRTTTMPQTGPVTHTTQSSVAPRLMIYTGFFVDPSLLRVGRNVLALSLHGYEDEENSSDRIAAVRLVLTEGWDSGPLSTRPEHFRILWLENPQSEAMVSWTTSAPSKRNTLYFDTVSRDGELRAYRNRQAPAKTGRFATSREDLDLGTRPGHYHHVHLEGLQPDTTYYLVMESNGIASREFHFRTAPGTDLPFKVLFGGDSRISGDTPYFHSDRRAVNRRLVALLEENPDTLAFIHGGDFTQRAQWRYFRPWLTDHELTITQDGRILPIVVARGNHDMDVGFEEVFWWPGQENRYFYHTELTPEFSLITLNSEITHGGKQRQFLREALEAHRPTKRWITVSYHKPAYPSVRGFEGSADRHRFWVPLFDQHRIDLAFESHDHALKRTVPILNNQPHPDGVIYIGDGGLGVPQRNPDPTRWYLQEPGMTGATHHLHLLTVDGDAIRGVAYGIGGEVLDEFVIPRRDPKNGFDRLPLPGPATTADN